MPKPSLQLANQHTARTTGRHPEPPKDGHASPLAVLVSEHLHARGLRQIDFCRHSGFDQGLLSKILSSVVTTLNVETALKLAAGLNLEPSAVFEAIGKRDVHEMLRRVYSQAGDTERLM